MKQADLVLPYLYQALSTDWGLELAVSDYMAFQRAFYAARKTDESLACLSLRPNPFNSDLAWIVKHARPSKSDDTSELG